MYGSYQNAPTKPKAPGITDPLTNTPPSVPEASTPTPTDRLEKQIRRARLFLHDQVVYVEENFNGALTWAFRQETNFTNTIASLAPSPETGEQLMPGLIYVLVATMAGSIVSRNRNILIRATFPLAVGVTAGESQDFNLGGGRRLTRRLGWMLIPVTMRNTGDLLWKYEKKVPMVSETHAMIGGFARQAYKEVSQRSRSSFEWADHKAEDTRKKVEELVSEGR